MSKARPKHGQKADKGLKDIKIRNEAKYQSELSPTTIESTPEAKEQEFQNNLDYLLTNKERPAIVPDEQTYVTANVIEEIEIGVASQSGRNSGKPKASKRSARRNNFTVAEIVKDIGGLQFSSDDDEGVNLEIESVAVTSSHGPAKRNKKKPKKKNQEKKTLNECVGRTQVITDENPNGASSSEKIISEHNNNSNGGGKEEPSQVCVSKDNKTLPNKVNTEPKRGAEKRKNSTKKDSKRGAGKDKLTHNNDEQGVSTSESKSPVKKSTKDKKSNQTRNHKQPPAVQDGETTLSKDDSKQNTKPSPIKSEHGQAPQTELKRKKNKSARKREPSKSRTDNTTSSPKVGLEKTHAPSRGVPGNPTKDNTIVSTQI
ncbi:hypothetical protein CANMA_001581 [Candida margitis]|uniref:uncharacterized protein n=1 Tax=Candida margitis TaxID=1775924 RepID=UPI002226173F|nr:uncharacterized protein CANMA_001581 [Candida margitis]KAI5969513.1 hypothetical protein CANMA_001581 [Candida margitis]